MPEHNEIARPLRILLGVIAIVGLVLAIWNSGNVAVSRILVRYAETVADSDAADNAIRMTPKDAEAHFVRGAISNYLNQPDAALAELEAAVSLRPRDYGLWLELGMTRDQLGNAAGGLLCLNEAVRLAPYYARPRWQRGNILFRMGRYDEAFQDLRQAAASNPDLLPNFIDLAWGASRNDPKLTEQIVQFQNNQGKLALTRFFAAHGKGDEALTLFRSNTGISIESRRALVQELLGTGQLSQAFEVWSTTPGAAHSERGTFYDGGFEAVLNLEEAGFGWRLARTEPGVAFSLDPGQPQTGARSLRIDFNGQPNPATQLLSQLILVEAGTHFKISFWARTKDISTGGPLIITVNDTKGAANQAPLGRSTSLPVKLVDWQNFSLEFTTGPATKAITVSLQRENCSSSPCPIFGVLNLDGFLLERVK